MNRERYPDPTADVAVGMAARWEKSKVRHETPPNVMQVVNMMRSIASIAGFEVAGRIHLRDKVTGREWR